jgi:hypothetical protein
MRQSKLFEVVFLHKVQKNLAMYWGDVGIENRRMKKYGAVEIWRTSHIHPQDHNTTYSQAYPLQCLALSSPVAAEGGFVCAILHAGSLHSWPLPSVCGWRGGCCKVPRTSYMSALLMCPGVRCRRSTKLILWTRSSQRRRRRSILARSASWWR